MRASERRGHVLLLLLLRLCFGVVSRTRGAGTTGSTHCCLGCWLLHGLLVSLPRGTSPTGGSAAHHGNHAERTRTTPPRMEPSTTPRVPAWWSFGGPPPPSAGPFFRRNAVTLLRGTSGSDKTNRGFLPPTGCVRGQVHAFLFLKKSGLLPTPGKSLSSAIRARHGARSFLF